MVQRDGHADMRAFQELEDQVRVHGVDSLTGPQQYFYYSFINRLELRAGFAEFTTAIVDEIKTLRVEHRGLRSAFKRATWPVGLSGVAASIVVLFNRLADR